MFSEASQARADHALGETALSLNQIVPLMPYANNIQDDSTAYDSGRYVASPAMQIKTVRLFGNREPKDNDTFAAIEVKEPAGANCIEPVNKPKPVEPLFIPEPGIAPIVALDIGVGIIYIPSLAKSQVLEDRLDITRDEFEPSMGPEFRDYLKVSDMFAALNLELGVTPTRLHILNGDVIRFTLSGSYSSSAIFGVIDDTRPFYPVLSALEFGETTTTWKQDLLGYYAALAKAEYGYKFDLGRGFGITPEANISLGVSYMDFKTTLRMFVLNENIFKNIGYESMAAFNIYRDRTTESTGSGVGILFRTALGANIGWRSISLSVNGGYQVENFGSFDVNEKQFNGGIPDQEPTVVEQSYSLKDYRRDGWFVAAMLRTTFDL